MHYVTAGNIFVSANNEMYRVLEIANSCDSNEDKLVVFTNVHNEKEVFTTEIETFKKEFEYKFHFNEEFETPITDEFIKPGLSYVHFKGNTYSPLTIAYDYKNTDLKKVVYFEKPKIKNEEDIFESIINDLLNKKVWVRDYNEFISDIDFSKYPNVKQTKRFSLIRK